MVGLATGAFVGTTVDNGLVTTAQVAAAPPRRRRRVVAGQFAGFAAIVALAAGGSAVLLELPLWVLGLLGLVPVALAVREVVAVVRRGGRPPAPKDPVGSGWFTAAVVTLGSGGDNLAVYIPLFRQAGPAWGTLAAVWLLALDAGLCAVAVWLALRPRALVLGHRVGAWLSPAAHLVVGVAVLVRAGTFSHLT